MRQSRFARVRQVLVPSILVLLLAARSVDAAVTLTWNPSPETDVTGYLVSVSSASGYSDTIDVGARSSFQFTEPNPAIAYSFSVRAYDSAGLVSAHSEVVQSTPLALPTGAILNGSGNPNGIPTIGYFEYGPTRAYGARTAVVALGAGTRSVAIGNGVVAGLACNTPYHFRSVAKNASGVVRGADKTFTTVPCGGTLPPGFSNSLLVGGLNNPTAMALLPDGRLFVSERDGSLRVVKDGVSLAKPFVSLTVDQSGDRGLLGVAIDPAFERNGYVYVYYTALDPNVHNRVSRLTANGDVAADGSETVVVDLDPVGSSTTNNGGALDFGSDGMLYVAVGDNGRGVNAQSLTNRFGKVLRLRTDGSIPDDNPFYGVAGGANRAIWALGLREPSSFAFQPLTGQMFVNDSGLGWEEINVGKRGANYGWAPLEGLTTMPGFISPAYTYDHATGCGIAGSAFHNLLKAQFPIRYWAGYFFADRCGGWIRFRSPDGSVSDFASGIASPVDLKMSMDGSLYVLAQGEGSGSGIVERIVYKPIGPTVDLAVNGSDDPAFLDPTDTFDISLSFDPRSPVALKQADVYIGVSTPFGDRWLDTTGGLVPDVVRVHSGALAAFGPTTVFHNRAALPSGPYFWFVIVDSKVGGAVERQFTDTAVTVIR